MTVTKIRLVGAYYCKGCLSDELKECVTMEGIVWSDVVFVRIGSCALTSNCPLVILHILRHSLGWTAGFDDLGLYSVLCGRLSGSDAPIRLGCAITGMEAHWDSLSRRLGSVMAIPTNIVTGSGTGIQGGIMEVLMVIFLP